MNDAALPKYVVSLKGGLYFKRRDYRTYRLPDLDDPDFEVQYNVAISQPPMRPSRDDIEIVRGWLLQNMKSAKGRAVRRSLEFTIDEAWLADRLLEINGRCEVTGIGFFKDREKHAPFAPSIDRVDPKQGYTPKNCRLVCYIVNCAKNQFTDAEFKFMCRMAAKQNINRT